MNTEQAPKLLTPGRIAQRTGVPLHRVVYVLAHREHIQPCAYAGRTRLYDKKGLAMIRHELNAIDARRSAKGVSRG